MRRGCLSLALVCIVYSAASADDPPLSFRRDVAPLLVAKCQACHGPKKAEGGYRVDTFERLLRGGDSSLPAFVAKAPDDSEGLRRITSDDKTERMPLDADPLPKESIDVIRRWIATGAPFDADDPAAPLIAILPPPTYPDPPAAYPQSLAITALAFRPDGEELYVGGYHEVIVRRPGDGELVRRINNVVQRVYAIRFSPDGKMLAAAGGAPGERGEVRLYDASSGNMIRALGATADVVLDAQFSPDGTTIAAAGADSVVRIFDIATGELTRSIDSHSDWVSAVAFSPDGKLLASASRDKTARITNLETGKTQTTFNEHGQPVLGVAFHRDGKLVFSSGEDNRVRLWNAADGKQAAETGGFGGHPAKIGAAMNSLFVPSADKTVKRIDAGSRNVTQTYTGHQDWVLSTAVHEEKKLLAAGCFDGRVRVWNVEDGKQIADFHALPGFEAGVNAAGAK